MSQQGTLWKEGAKKRKNNVPREASLVRAVEKELKALNVVYRKRWGGPYSVVGDPDLYFCWKGRHVEVELKRPGEKPTKVQQWRLHEWGEAGALCALVSSLAEFRLLLGELHT
jgi:hypothetical protein